MVFAVNILDIQMSPSLHCHHTENSSPGPWSSPLGRAVWVASVVRHFLVPKDFTKWDSIQFSCLECCNFFLSAPDWISVCFVFRGLRWYLTEAVGLQCVHLIMQG